MGIVPCFDPTTGASGGPSAGGGSPELLTVLEVDWPALWVANGSTNVDLSAAGTYSLGGTSFVVDQHHSGMTATLKSTGLHLESIPGSNADWMISLDENKATEIANYVVLTCDISATVSTNTSTPNSAGLYAVGYTRAPTWGSNPGNTAIGAGLKVRNANFYDRTGVVRNTTYFESSNGLAKVVPSTFHHRAFFTGTTYAGGVHTSAFTQSELAPAGALYPVNCFEVNNPNLPHQHDYRTNAYPAVWIVGGANTGWDVMITKTTWTAWPTPTS
tara:strand:+ start:160 stop:978 length:819 start_codon:yes stop_codon:yes gene_type:complete